MSRDSSMRNTPRLSPSVVASPMMIRTGTRRPDLESFRRRPVIVLVLVLVSSGFLYSAASGRYSSLELPQETSPSSTRRDHSSSSPRFDASGHVFGGHPGSSPAALED